MWSNDSLFLFSGTEESGFERLPKETEKQRSLLVQCTVVSDSLCCHHSITIQHSSTNLSTHLLKRLNEFACLIPNLVFFFFLTRSSWLVNLIISLPKNKPRLAVLWSTERFMRNSIISKRQESFSLPFSVSLQTIVRLEASVLWPICRLFESGMSKIKFPGSQRVFIPCANSQHSSRWSGSPTLYKQYSCSKYL